MRRAEKRRKDTEAEIITPDFTAHLYVPAALPDDIPPPDGQIRQNGKPRKYPFTPRMDERIREVYRKGTGKRQVKALADTFGYPRHAVSHRALEIRALQPRIKEPRWCEQELHILELNALRTPKIIQKRLKMAGFNRSVYGIDLKRQRLCLRQQQVKGTARAVAACFGVDPHTITRLWIGKGLLKATRRGTDRTPQQGGDEWHIKERDIRNFIIENVGIIDIRKVDKYWLVDILTGESHL